MVLKGKFAFGMTMKITVQPVTWKMLKEVWNGAKGTLRRYDEMAKKGANARIKALAKKLSVPTNVIAVKALSYWGSEPAFITFSMVLDECENNIKNGKPLPWEEDVKTKIED